MGDTCSSCFFWGCWTSQSRGLCHHIYSDFWHKWTLPNHVCPWKSPTPDPTVDDREESACHIRR